MCTHTYRYVYTHTQEPMHMHTYTHTHLHTTHLHTTHTYMHAPTRFQALLTNQALVPTSTSVPALFALSTVKTVRSL